MADRPAWSTFRYAAALLLPLAGGCSAVESTSADRFTATGQLVALSGSHAGAANACFTCHGLDGLGNGAGAPRLAGMQLGYLDRQLEAYATGRRKHPQMDYIAKKLSSRDRQLVSAYYAAMPFVPSEMPPVPPPALYVTGDPQRGLQACADCHGLRGEGIGPANPALGAQPPAYLAEQLEKWRRSQRRSDPLDVMLKISQLLTPAELSALAAYAGALPGGPQHPGSQATYREAHRDDPRNDVSGLRPHVAVR